jgi:hypothetical protein
VENNLPFDSNISKMYTTIFPFILILTLWFNGKAIAQSDFPERTKLALKAGDSQKLSRNCAEKIEFGIEGDAESINSQAAGERLSKFFRENPPVDANVQFQGKGKDGRKYMVCKYKTKSGSAFRISFYWKEKLPEQFEAIDISRD